MALAALAVALLFGCGDDDDLPQRSEGGHPAFGFNENSVRAGLITAERQAELAAGVGAEVIRLTFDWRFAERQPDDYDFREYDAVYRALRAEGIKPLWIPMFAPPWAWDSDVACSTDCRYPPSREAEGEWGELLARIARRYPDSAGIELWNEPNLPIFWRPSPDPERYVRLMRVGYRAVKRVAPDMPVAGGSVSNTQSTENGHVTLSQFLEGLYENGGRDYMDALSVHAYPAWRTDPILERSMNQVLAAREKHKDGKPIWVTEVGATTTGSNSDLRWNEEEQAQTLLQAYDTLAKVPDVEMVLLHTLLEPPGTAEDPNVGYGIARTDGTPKATYCAFARKFRAAGAEAAGC